MSSIPGACSLGTLVGPVLAPLFIIGVFGFAGPLYAFALIAVIMIVVVALYLDEAPIFVTKPPFRSDKTSREQLWLRCNFAPSSLTASCSWSVRMRWHRRWVF